MAKMNWDSIKPFPRPAIHRDVHLENKPNLDNPPPNSSRQKTPTSKRMRGETRYLISRDAPIMTNFGYNPNRYIVRDIPMILVTMQGAFNCI